VVGVVTKVGGGTDERVCGCRVGKLVVDTMFNTINNKRIAVLGFAFKADTGDTRESPAIDICGTLLAENAKVVLSIRAGAGVGVVVVGGPISPIGTVTLRVAVFSLEQVCVYDPEAKEKQIRHDLASYNVKGNLSVAADAYEACKDAHAVIVITEWKCVPSPLFLFSFFPPLPVLFIFLIWPLLSTQAFLLLPFSLNLAMRCRATSSSLMSALPWRSQAIQGARLPTHFRCDEQAGLCL
jgi:hypothetical protein